MQTYTLPFGGGPKLIRAAYFIQIGTNQPTIALVMPTNTDTGQNYILYCYLETSRLDNKWSHSSFVFKFIVTKPQKESFSLY